MKIKIRKILPWIGIAIFIILLFRLNISSIINEIKNSNLFFLLVAVLFMLITLFTQTFKWFVIARVQRIEVPYLKAFVINLISDFYGFITPSRIGNIIRADYLKEYNKNKLGGGVSNYILDKILDICSLVFLAMIFSFIFRNWISINYFYYAVVLMGFLIAGLVIIRDEKKMRFFFGIFYRKLVPEKIKSKIKGGVSSFYENMPKKRYFILFFVVNLLNWVVIYLPTYFIGLSLGINLPFIYYLAILPVATLVAQIPITISGLGTREATMIGLFGIFGIEATKVFSMSIIGIFIGLIPLLIGSFLIFKNTPKPNGKG